MADKPPMGQTMAGAAIKFVTGPRKTNIPDQPAQPSAVHAAVDHPASKIFQGIIAIACIAFAIQPVQLAFEPSVHVVPLALEPLWRKGLAVFGILLLPYIPDAFSRGVAGAAAGVRTVIELWQSFRGKPKE